MQHPPDTTSYILYARKSSESEDRQVQSIDDQVDRLTELATQRGLRVVHTYAEARSAKAPDQRPIFSQMIERIERGEAQGILCWRIDRLSRNPIDSGRLHWLLQRGVLKSIQTIEREYRPEDNVLLITVETGMATQYVLDLSKNVKRGIRGKLERGELPGRAPAGYLNDSATRTVVKDPDRFLTVRRAWEALLSGNESVPDVLRKLNDRWGFRTMRRKRSGGKPLTESALYRIFANPFYAGIIRVNGVSYTGKHEPMVTLGEFERAQEVLGRRDRPRPSKHRFMYSKVLRCGECGSYVTAEQRSKYIKSEGRARTYTYYHCTHRRDPECSQRACVPEETVTELLRQALARFTIDPDFARCAVGSLVRHADELRRKDRERLNAGREEVRETERQIANLTRMRYRELVSDEEYLAERDLLVRQLARMRSARAAAEAERADIVPRLCGAFELLAGLDAKFSEGNAETKLELLGKVGSNHLLRDGKAHIQVNFFIQPIVELAPALEQKLRAIEPPPTPINTIQKDAFASLSDPWSTLVEEVHNRIKAEMDAESLNSQ